MSPTNTDLITERQEPCKFSERVLLEKHASKLHKPCCRMSYEKKQAQSPVWSKQRKAAAKPTIVVATVQM